MNQLFSEDHIPKTIQESLYQIHSLRIRQSFLQLLENANKRNNNPNNTL